jgi:hypothetical protein
MRFRRIKTRSFCILLLACLASFGASGFAQESNEFEATSFTTSPRESVLLLGDPTVARTSGLTQRFFPAQKHPANPVLRRAEPWEGNGPYLWGSRLMQDSQSPELRLCYIAYRHEDNHYRWGYATSLDGLKWTR